MNYLLNFMYPDVYNYLNELPDNVEIINLSNKNLTFLPNLSRFNNLRQLYIDYNRLKKIHSLPSTLELLSCHNNKLSRLPSLPLNLKILTCTNNVLKSLPKLPINLKILHCNNNELTSLPQLPPHLKKIYCWRNQLTTIPSLPESLISLYCNHNRLYCFYSITESVEIACHQNPIYNDILCEPKKYHNLQWYTKIKILNNFRHLYYSLKFKKQFRDWLWVRIREPKIRKKYCTDNLLKLINGCEDEEIFDNLLSNW